jgi:outer membrane protein OmpA-like peptidoglycan-associated protein
MFDCRLTAPFRGRACLPGVTPKRISFEESVMKIKSSKSILAASILALATSGCADMSATQRGTATGAGVGAGLGAILGASTGGGGSGRATRGAVLGGAAGAVIGNIWSKRMEQQKQAMEQATRGTGVQVSQTSDNRLKLEIPSDISFDTNRADIKPNFRPILDRFATTLNENPATTVTVIGHTDSTGGDAINQPLSVNRAASTRDYLAARGVNPGRIAIEGRGAREPIASNDDPTGRAHNRRVEIFVAEHGAQG